MIDSLELMSARTKLARKPATSPEIESDEDECAAFGYLRGVRDRSLNLELRFLNKNCLMLPYNWLGPVKYDPSHGILAKFVGDLTYLVLIEGSNLNLMVANSITLFDRGLHRHRVIWVREMSRQAQERAGEGETIIERIRTVSYRPDEGPPDVEWLEPFRHESESK